MHIPTDRWIDDGWHDKRSQFHALLRMLGHNESTVSLDQLQGLFTKVATPKLFGESVEAFIGATTEGKKRSAADRVEEIERKLGLTEPIPFRSLEGLDSASEFRGVAFWLTGTVNWTNLRLEQIRTEIRSGANIWRIICLNGSRTCNGAADLRHPLLKGVTEDNAPTERQLQQRLASSCGLDTNLFVFPDLPDKNAEGKVLSHEQQLMHLVQSGQYDELVGGENIYVPSNANALYLPLHVMRILALDNVWFSQAGARVWREMPKQFSQVNQWVMTLPQGNFRLLGELIRTGCLDESNDSIGT